MHYSFPFPYSSQSTRQLKISEHPKGLHAAPRKSRVRDKRAVLPSSPVGYTAYEMWCKIHIVWSVQSSRQKQIPPPPLPRFSNPVLVRNLSQPAVVCIRQGLSFKAPTIGISFISFEFGAAKLVEDHIANCSGLHCMGFEHYRTASSHYPLAYHTQAKPTKSTYLA